MTAYWFFISLYWLLLIVVLAVGDRAGSLVLWLMALVVGVAVVFGLLLQLPVRIKGGSR